MKHNLIWLPLVSLPLAAVIGTAIACGDLGSATSPAAMASHPAAAAVSRPADLTDSPLALTVVGPTGARYHLVFTAGKGWQLVDLPSRSAIVNVKSGDAFAPAVTPTSGEIHPQTVFIDGLTGYTFVWVPERGWKFLGNIAPAGG